MLNTSPFATTIMCHVAGVLKYFMFRWYEVINPIYTINEEILSPN